MSETRQLFKTRSVDGGVAITGFDDSAIGDAVDLVIPSTIEGQPVVEIAEFAFSGCTTLTSVVIPDSVHTIGENAFSFCSSLTKIVVPNSVHTIDESAFSDCSSLTSVVLPDSVRTIGRNAFSGCSSLTSINIPSALHSINEWAFSDCSSLTSVVIPEGVLVICNNAFSGSLSLASVVIPGSLQGIGDSVFAFCSSLRHIEIPKSVRELGKNVFEGCPVKIRCYEWSAAERWVKENNVDNEIIGYSPEPVNITDNTDSCSREQVLPEPTNSIAQNVRYRTKSVDGGIAIMWVDRSSLGNVTDLVIPSTIDGKPVVEIADIALDHCSSLTSVVIPNSVKSIGGFAFSDCTSLTSVVIPNSVQSIGEWAFSDCTSLTSVVIPNSVKSIGGFAFSDCTSLTSVVIPNSVQMIGDGAFDGCPVKLLVHKGSSAEKCAKQNSHDCEQVPFPEQVPLPDFVLACEQVPFPEQVPLPDFVLACEQVPLFESRRVANGLAITGVDISSLGIATNLVIPSTINGKPIVEIADFAFKDCSSLINIVVPDSVLKIGKLAFSNCSWQTIIIIPESVKAIDNLSFFTGPAQLYVCNNSYAERWAVYHHVNYKVITSYATIANAIKNDTPIPITSFLQAPAQTGPIFWTKRINGGLAITGVDTSSLDNATELIIPSVIYGERVIEIADAAFYIDFSLTIVVIPDSVHTIGDWVFSICHSMKYVVIPRSVKRIGKHSFADCSARFQVYKGSYAEQWVRENNHNYQIIQ